MRWCCIRGLAKDFYKFSTETRKIMSKKKTFVTLEQLKEIDKTYPTPYHLYDEKGIRENAKRLKDGIKVIESILL